MRPRRSHVEITEHSIFIDGRDVSHLTRSVDVKIGVNEVPTVYVGVVPYLVTLDLDAAVVEYSPPLNGIDRLRERLGR